MLHNGLVGAPGLVSTRHTLVGIKPSSKEAKSCPSEISTPSVAARCSLLRLLNLTIFGAPLRFLELAYLFCNVSSESNNGKRTRNQACGHHAQDRLERLASVAQKLP